MPDEALLDAPEVEEVDLGTETTETETSDASTGSDTQTETTQREATDPVITDANGQLKLSGKARAELDRIKAENPRLAREMRAALFDRKTLLSKIPGGVKEALATIEAYEAEGGSEAVKAAKEENQLWQGLDADFKAGNPKFVEDIAQGNPEAFAKLAPTVMTKFAELAPDAFSYQVSKVFAQDMAANDVMLTMRLFQREIAALPEANRGPVGELWKQLAAYVDRVNGMAKTPPKQEQVTPKGALTSELDQREQALTIREFGSEKARVLDSVTASELAKNAGNRKFSEEKLSTIRELYSLALDKLVKSIPGHTAKVDRFVAAKDRVGYRKHMEAAIRSKAPMAMEQAFRKAGVGGKPGPVQAKTAAKPAASQARPANTGFTRVATKPDHNAVDWTKTARIPGKKGGDGKFIMRDGSRVLYQR